MRSVTARDLMVPLEQYPCVTVDCPLKEAADKLENWQIEMDGLKSMARVLLVFDDEEGLQGVVRRRDILRGFGPDLFTDLETEVAAALFPVDPDPNLIELLTFSEFDKLGENAGRPVSDIMREVPGTADSDETMVSLLQKITRGDYYLMPVLEDGHVIGVVRTVEVLRRVLLSLC